MGLSVRQLIQTYVTVAVIASVKYHYNRNQGGVNVNVRLVYGLLLFYLWGGSGHMGEPGGRGRTTTIDIICYVFSTNVFGRQCATV